MRVDCQYEVLLGHRRCVRRCTDEACTDVYVVLGKRADLRFGKKLSDNCQCAWNRPDRNMTHIPGLLIVGDDFLVITAGERWTSSETAGAGGSVEDGLGEGCAKHGD